MNYLLIIPRALWKLLFILNFVLGLIILYPLFFIFLSKREWFPKAFQLKKFWARWILIVPGLFYKITYRIPANKLPQPAVYCANHSSYLDIVYSYLVIPKYFVFMGKQELNKAPLFRIFFRQMNILVDRSSNASAHRAFIRAGKDIDEGHSAFLFPEGGISSNGKLKGFKNGAFKLAIEKQVPVVPITYLNNWKLLQNGGFFKSIGRPGVSRIIVHEPVSTAGMTENDLVSLLSKVRNIIQNELEKNES
ncbi:MAG: lysophospholipid acyltransferase family protein [Bacteroidia bacterium]